MGINKSSFKYRFHMFKRQFKPVVEITSSCISCGKCMKVCPVPECIAEGKPYSIDAEVCMRCGKCVKSCPVDAITRQ